jgi:hypothetical protein
LIGRDFVVIFNPDLGVRLGVTSVKNARRASRARRVVATFALCAIGCRSAFEAIFSQVTPNGHTLGRPWFPPPRRSPDPHGLTIRQAFLHPPPAFATKPCRAVSDVLFGGAIEPMALDRRVHAEALLEKVVEVDFN